MTKICTTIIASSTERMMKLAEEAVSLGSELLEFRLDSMKEIKDLEKLKSFTDRCIFTFRRKEEGGFYQIDDLLRLKHLQKACKLYPAYVDIEMETIAKFPKMAKEIARSADNLIVSYHDLNFTPSFTRIKAKYEQMSRTGDLVKLVYRAKSFKDNLSVLKLYKLSDRNLIAFCSGKAGVASRILGMMFGSPIVYSCLPFMPASPGQLSVDVIKEISSLYRSVVEMKDKN
ncbi:MAG: type I 3-dehydroquinate dehydratase [Nitrososphaerota archaeon]